jgi:putative transposase
VLDARFSYRGEDVVATLDRICAEVGFPRTIRVDQGSEFISRDLDFGPTTAA